MKTIMVLVLAICALAATGQEQQVAAPAPAPLEGALEFITRPPGAPLEAAPLPRAGTVPWMERQTPQDSWNVPLWEQRKMNQFRVIESPPTVDDFTSTWQ